MGPVVRVRGAGLSASVFLTYVSGHFSSQLARVGLGFRVLGFRGLGFFSSRFRVGI